jgi:hypothetical protein
VSESERLERIARELERVVHEQRETNRLLMLLIKEEAPKQLASSGAVVTIL